VFLWICYLDLFLTARVTEAVDSCRGFVSVDLFQESVRGFVSVEAFNEFID
jgi:hypothetical protein